MPFLKMFSDFLNISLAFGILGSGINKDIMKGGMSV